MLEIIISSFLFTWVGGLFLPVILRFLFIKKPIRKFYAILIIGVVFIMQYLTVAILNPERKTHLPLFIVAYIGYLILRKESNKKEGLAKKYCKECGNEINVLATICNKCGKEIINHN